MKSGGEAQDLEQSMITLAGQGWAISLFCQPAGHSPGAKWRCTISRVGAGPGEWKFATGQSPGQALRGAMEAPLWGEAKATKSPEKTSVDVKVERVSVVDAKAEDLFG